MTRRQKLMPALVAIAVGAVGATGFILFGPRPGHKPVSELAAFAQAPTGLAADLTTSGQTIGPLTPPKPGIYNFHTTGSVEGSALGGRTDASQNSSITVKPTDGAPSDGSTYLTYSTQSGIRGGEDIDHVWKKDGEFILRNHQRVFTGFGTASGTCEYNPALLSTPSDLAVGRSWTNNANCNVEASGAKLDLIQKATMKVTGTKKFNIGGKEVNTYVIETVSDLTQSGSIQGQNISEVVQEKSTQLYDPAISMSVHTLTVVASTSSRGQKVTRQTDTTLIDLEPEPAS